MPLSGKSASTQIHDNFKEWLREINDGNYFVTDPNISFQDQLNANRAMHEAQPMTEDLRACQRRRAAGWMDTEGCSKILDPKSLHR